MGTPSKQNNTIKLDRYDQQVNDQGLQSGNVVLDMRFGWNEFTLSGDVIDITTSNDLASDERSTFTFSVKQPNNALYTIDWLASGKFISSLDSAALQPPLELGSSTRYQATWNGISYELLIDSSGNNAYSPEVQAVIDRMTTPSGEFKAAINEYVAAEMGAVNDNWGLTDEVFMLMADTEINVNVGWKYSAITSKTGTVIFTAYGGMDFGDLDVVNALNTDLSLFDSPIFLINDSFTSVSIVNYTNDTTVRYLFEIGTSTSGTRTYNYLNPTTARVLAAINGIGVTQDDAAPYPVNDSIYITQQIATKSEGILDGIIRGTNVGTATAINTGIIRIGRGASNTTTWAYNGIMSHIAFGGGIGFDPIAHDINIRNYKNRMLIQKHTTVVNTVLDRYTDLTVRESFALSRLVARSEENGNWALLDEVFVLGLYTKSNALIGTKQVAATNIGATYIEGRGFENLDVNTIGVNTNFIPSTMSTAVTKNVYAGGIFHQYLRAGNSFAYSTEPRNCGWHQIGSTRVYIKSSGYVLAPDLSAISSSVHFSTIRDGATNRQKVYLNDTLSLDAPQTEGNLATSVIHLLHRPIINIDAYNGVAKAFHYGQGVGVDVSAWNTDLHQCISELEIGKANDNNDWNIQDKIYDWANRELAADQLEELVGIIDPNSNGTTTGRTFDIIGNLGITLNAQVSLDSLTTKGFVILQ